MPLADLVPLAPITENVPTVLTWAPGPVPAPIYVEPEPPEGDPDTPHVPAVPRRLGRRVEVHAQTPAGEYHGAFRTALVESWDDPLVGASRLTARVSQHDPLLDHLGLESAVIRGRRTMQLDGKRLNLLVTVDGKPKREAFLDEPVDIGDGMLSLNGTGGMGLLDGVTVQSGDFTDLYLGRGDFETYGTTAQLLASGVDADEGVDVELTTSNVFTGGLAMRVKGTGMVRFWPVTVPGSTDHAFGYIASALVKMPGDGTSTLKWGVHTMPTPGFAAVRFARDADPMVVDGDDDQFQAVEGGYRIARTGQPHRVRALAYVASPDWVYIDAVRLIEDAHTGSFGQDTWEMCILRLIRASAQKHPGHGTSIQILSESGETDRMVIRDSERKNAADAIAEYRDRLGGPDVWCRPDWTFAISARRGRDNIAFILDNTTVISGTISIDAGAEVDEFTTFTGLGSGAGELVLRSSTPVTPGRRRPEAAVRAPDAPYARQRAWHEAQAEYAAREAMSGEFLLPWNTAAMAATGDGLKCAWSDGKLGWWKPVRVGNMTWLPQSETCRLEVGTHPVVAEDF